MISQDPAWSRFGLVSGMHFDPLTLLIVPVLLLVGAGGVAAWRFRSGGLVPWSETFDRTEPPVLQEEFNDGLTGIGNRLAFARYGAALLGTALANSQGAAVLVLDLDRFAGINAADGRDAGDRLLVAFARMIHDYLPPTSLVCRLGADTFAAILPAAGLHRAYTIAEEIRLLFAHYAVASPRGPLQATVSVGVAVTGEVGVDLESLLQRADLCLDRAKAGGRDRVETEGRPEDARQQRRGAA